MCAHSKDEYSGKGFLARRKGKGAPHRFVTRKSEEFTRKEKREVARKKKMDVLFPNQGGDLGK